MSYRYETKTTVLGGQRTPSYQVFGSVAATQPAWCAVLVSGVCEIFCSIGNLAITEAIRLLYPFVSPKVYVVSLRNQDDSVGLPKDSILSSFWKCGCNTACVVSGLVSGVCESTCSIGNYSNYGRYTAPLSVCCSKSICRIDTKPRRQCWAAKGLHPIKFLEVWL